MAHLSKIFTKVPVDIPNRSGFDLSFENLLTMKVGTLTPVLCEEVIPNETYSLGYLSQVQLPPMATNFFGRVDMRLEAFFVPNRILWGGWQNFFTMPTNNPYGTPTVRPVSVPTVSIETKLFTKSRELLDYLGLRNFPGTTGRTLEINLLPLLAYHRVYDEWYRNSKITKPAFVRVATDGATRGRAGNLPWISGAFNHRGDEVDYFNLADGVSIFDLRQRCWGKDYFTTASLFPQADGTTTGATAAIEDGKISISSLRSANVLQRWLERNNIAGERYADQINAHFGVMPSDALIDRPIFLGSSKFGVYNRSVMQTVPASGDSQNPFTTVGAKAASTSGTGQSSLFGKFHSTEHGYILVLGSIVPHANYASGMRRYLLHTKIGDFAFPLMQGLGEQSIDVRELNSSLATATFGYQQQYSEYKYHDDEVHGLLRPGFSLDSFVLSRSFDDTSLNTSFVTIPTNAMDNVTAVAGDLTKYGAWADFYFSFKKVSPLSEYVQPTLGDLRNTHTENIDYRGKNL